MDKRAYSDPEDPRNLFAAMYGGVYKREDPYDLRCGIYYYLQILSPRPPLQRPLPRPDAVSEELRGEARPQEEQLPRLERPQGSLRPEVSFVEVIEVSHFSSHFSIETWNV